MSDWVVRADKLTCHYRSSAGWLRSAATVAAVTDVCFTLRPGRTLAVVGESGSGKTTLGMTVAGVKEPTAGRIDWSGGSGAGQVRMIFQDTYGSLHRRMRAGRILEEPLRINTRMSGAERRDATRDMLERVGLGAEHGARYPHELSGGQRQRVAIGRALMLRPAVVVADEPVAALDMSLRNRMLNLLQKLQEEFNVAYLFISHSLAVVERVSDEVMVLYRGRAVEQGAREQVLRAPHHPYTKTLLDSTLYVAPERRRRRARSVRGTVRVRERGQESAS